MKYFKIIFLITLILLLAFAFYYLYFSQPTALFLKPISNLARLLDWPDGGPTESKSGGELFIYPEVLTFGPNEFVKSFTLSTSNPNQALNYTIESSQFWFWTSPKSGTLQSPVEIKVVTGYCLYDWTAGVRTGQVVVRTSDGQEKTVQLNFNLPAKPSDSEILALISKLSPLPKPHFDWYLDRRWLNQANHPILKEIARVTGAVSIKLPWFTPQQVDNAVRACVLSGPPGCSLGVNESPYHDFLPAGAPPTYNGPEVAATWNYLRERFGLLKQSLSQANLKYGGNVGAVILYDAELWATKPVNEPGAQAWNQALTAKHNAIYDIAKQFFPNAPVDWYGRGAHDNQLFTLEEKGDSFNRDLYYPTNIQLEETITNQLRANARQHLQNGGNVLSAWLSLGSGWLSMDPHPQVPGKPFFCAWDYPLDYSRQIGERINNSDYKRSNPDSVFQDLDRIILYPGIGEYPYFWKHFAAYVEGVGGEPPPPPPPPPTFPPLTGPLGLGMKNERVELLQRMLVAYFKLDPATVVTSRYDQKTVELVQRFQCAEKIVCAGSPETTGYGLAGPKTRDRLNALFAGGQESLIRQLQLRLIELLRQLIALLLRGGR